MSAKTTHVRRLDHAVAWDESEQRHVYVADADLVFGGSEILHVGPGYAEPANKGLTEEVGSDKLGQSSLYEYLPVFGLDAEDAGPSTTVAMSELLKSGVTTITDLSISRPGWLDDL